MICCRVSPSQKADVVTLIQEFTHGEVSLAIGDGANDVAMIQVSREEQILQVSHIETNLNKCFFRLHASE